MDGQTEELKYIGPCRKAGVQNIKKTTLIPTNSSSILQKASSLVRHTYISENLQNWSLQVKNIKNLSKNQDKAAKA